METKVAESRIQRALKSKHSLASKYLILTRYVVSVHREITEKLEGPFNFTQAYKNIISVTGGIEIKTFKYICQVLPISPKSNDADCSATRYLVSTTQILNKIWKKSKNMFLSKSNYKTQ